MKKTTLLLLVGTAASGKSTFRKGLVTCGSNWIVASRDELRKAIYNYTDEDLSAYYTCPNIKAREALISIMIRSLIVSHRTVSSVVVDATNLKISHIEDFIMNYSDMYDVKIKVFDIDEKTAIQRDQNRVASVGKAVIQKQYNQFQSLKNSQRFKDLLKGREYDSTRIKR